MLEMFKRLDKQRKLLVVLASTISLIILFPPYIISYGKYARINTGFSFLFDLPSRASVNIPLLFAEIACALLVGAIIFFVIRRETPTQRDGDYSEFYAVAEKEVDDNAVDGGLWSKALIEANGDESLRKIEYMKLRVQQLKTQN